MRLSYCRATEQLAQLLQAMLLQVTEYLDLKKWLRKCLFNPAIDYNIGQTPLNTLRKCNNFLATGFPRWLLGFYRHFLMYKKCHTCREACSESGELGHIVWQASAAEWWRKSVGREVFPFAQASNEDIWRNRSQLEFVPFVSWRHTARQDGAETCAFYNRFLLSCKLPQLIRDTRGLRVEAALACLAGVEARRRGFRSRRQKNDVVPLPNWNLAAGRLLKWRFLNKAQ